MMLDQIEKILQDNSLCVLCTDGLGKPHCSLMTYVLGEDPRILWMVATKESRKCRNLLNNPQVSVLVDNRQNLSTTAKTMVTSVTFDGVYHPVEQGEFEKIRSLFITAHPELTEIFKSPDCLLFGIQLKSYLLLNGPVNSFHGDI